MDGILPIYKPVTATSYDIIRAFKRIHHPKYKIGHGGTLDPFADGVLLLLLGKATKEMNRLMTLPKTYRATAVLGVGSDTLDLTGNLIKSETIIMPRLDEITCAAAEYVGRYEQEIPQYSAAKVNGKPRYLLARKGEVTEKKTKLVEIYNLAINEVSENKVSFTAQVSSGTYIRQLSYDIFKKIGIESHLTELTRTAIGPYTMENCAKLNELETEAWLDKVVPLESLVRGASGD